VSRNTSAKCRCSNEVGRAGAQVQEGLVINRVFVGKVGRLFSDNVGTAGDEARQQREEKQARQGSGTDSARQAATAPACRVRHRSLQSQMEGLALASAGSRILDPAARLAGMQTEQQNSSDNFGWVQAAAPTEEELGRMRKAADIQKQIEQLQLNVGHAAGKPPAVYRPWRAGKEETDRLRARFSALTEGNGEGVLRPKKGRREIPEGNCSRARRSHSTKNEVVAESRTAQGTEAAWGGGG